MSISNKSCRQIKWAGIDVGSTTVKIVIIDPVSNKVLHSRYTRHNASQAQTVYNLLEEAHELFGDSSFQVAVCGSGGLSIAEAISAFYIQEVVANSLAVRTFYTDARVAIELGGQDAKVIFFRRDETTGQIVASDMRMNGSCAGGTGAFIDQVAELLHIPTEKFESLAARGKTVYDISGRCGVFAKTDIQPLLNQGVSKEDIALSSFHAIAKQTIGGLAQGMEIKPSVIFEGGPLTFNPTLIKVFQKRLALSRDKIIIPDNPELLIAHGAALSIDTMFKDKQSEYSRETSLPALWDYIHSSGSRNSAAEDQNGDYIRFFENPEEEADFRKRYPKPQFEPKTVPPGSVLPVYIGIDAGSTTTKFVLLDENEEVVDLFYSNNHGDPLHVIKNALIAMRDKYRNEGVQLKVLGSGTTGYGELLFAKALHADFHSVETVAHAEAAKKYAPGATFILDIGGQDMKAISLKNGVITGIILNEACSAGCGSFIETYARSLGIRPDKIAEMSFQAENPSRLGSRCTVFMNSSIITEQKNGKTTEDILAGVSRSIIENVFTKVVRISNLENLGEVIVAQGGTFKNDAVLRAFEQYLENQVVIRPPFPGEMGAIGIALLTKRFIENKEKQYSSFSTSFIQLDELEQFSYNKKPGLVCNFCSNNCSRTLIEFNDGTSYITGNRCERGEIIGDISDPKIRKRLKETNKHLHLVPDMVRLQNELLLKDYQPKPVSPPKNIRYGIPRALEFWASMPFWTTFLKALGFDVVISSKSSYDLFEDGLASVPSDTVCFPAKIAHGHVRDLIKKGVDRIFMPMMVRIPKENRTAHGNHVCSVVQGYPLVIEKSDEPDKRGIPFDSPAFHWYNEKLKYRQTIRFFSQQFGIPRIEVFRALKEGDRAMAEYRTEMHRAGREVVESLGKKYDFGVVLAGRPYHADELVNHNLSSHFTRMGIPVLVLDNLPNIHKQDLTNVRIETTIPFHTRLIEGTFCVAKNPNLELVQIVSFGCGHDAVLSDEMARILKESAEKELLILKLDEGEAQGPLNIRIKSFIETVKVKRESERNIPKTSKVKKLKEAFATKFLLRDKQTRTVLAPNLSPAFSTIASAALRKEGYSVYQMPLADREAIELGKKYVHNDICFPAQVNIGEALRNIKNGKFDPGKVALGLAKNCEDCRAGQYAALARKALDEAGYPQIPIMTTGRDTKRMHPGAKLGPSFQINMVWGLSMMDGLEMMKRSTRPYEITKGRTEELFQEYLHKISETFIKSRRAALRLLEEAVEEFNRIPVNREKKRPRVGIVGEILLNYHPVSNRNIETYLEDNGMEVFIPSMLDFFRRSYIIEKNKAKRNLLPNPLLNLVIAGLTDKIIEKIISPVNKILKKFRFCCHQTSIGDLVRNIESLIDVSYIVGEGWLMPAEIIQMIKNGINSIVIVQPFGCLPNHITGRGMIKTIKKIYPHVQILSLDYDPDTSFANVENRLQMLIITAKEMEKNGVKSYDKAS